MNELCRHSRSMKSASGVRHLVGCGFAVSRRAEKCETASDLSLINAIQPNVYARRGFTLVEVLATLLLMALVLPAAMEGVSLAVQSSSAAQHRSEAAGLAEGKLNELVTTGEWQTASMSGGFDGAFSGYKWVATVSPWSQDTSGENIQQIDMTVSWISRNRPQSVTLSTLTYVRTSS